MPSAAAGVSSPGRAALCGAFAAFVFQLEATVVGVTLPSIVEDLRLTTADAGFVVTSYLLSAIVFLLPAGQLADRRSLRGTFLLGASLLAAGTLLCGVAPGTAWLLAGRVVAGAGAGGIAAAGYALVPAFVEPEGRGAAYGIISLFAGLGMLTGNPVGGFLAQYLPWRGVFLVNVPVMAALVVFGSLEIPRQAPSRSAGPRAGILDAFLVGLVAATAVTVLGLGDDHGWTSRLVLTIGAISVLLALVLALRQRRAAVSVLDPRLLREPGLRGGIAALFLIRVVIGGVTFLMPFYLELGTQLQPAAVGTVLLGYAGVFAFTAWNAGRLSDRIGTRSLVTLSLACASASCLAFAALLGRRSVPIALGFLLALGLSAGAFFPANNRSAMAAVPALRAGEASALLVLALNLGSAVGVPLLETIATTGRADEPDLESVADLLRGFRRAFSAGGILLACAAAAAAASIVSARSRAEENA